MAPDQGGWRVEGEPGPAEDEAEPGPSARVSKARQVQHRVSGFVLQSLICTCSGLYIHLGTKMKYFYKSIQFMLGGQVYMFILIIRMLTCFSATSAACRLVATYYNKTDQGSQSRTICVMNQIIYYVWAAVCLATIIIRIFALQYLVRSYKFLARKARDKEKRKLHELDRKRKDRRRRKRAL